MGSQRLLGASRLVPRRIAARDRPSADALGRPAARSAAVELPTFWFVGALVDLEVLWFQQVSRPVLIRNPHEGAHSGTECYVFATVLLPRRQVHHTSRTWGS